MTADLQNAVLDRLKSLYPPQIADKAATAAQAHTTPPEHDIVALGLVSGIFIADSKVFFSITVPDGQAQAWEAVRAQAEKTVAQLSGVRQVFAALTAEKPQNTASGAAGPGLTAPQNSPPQRLKAAAKQPLLGVRHIIAVASGKGGVGKSTIAVNLAAALQRMGLKIGLLDADIYGPSLPKLTGIAKPRGQDIIHFQDKKIVPLQQNGLKLMSMGFLAEEGAPLVWRGPMVMAAVNQLLHDVLWAPLDILVVDLPPGTGDAQLTLAQKVPLSGAVIVSTPQELALIDARKGLEMFAKIHVPILGIIENMSYFIAPDTGRRYHIFGAPDALGRGGAQQEAASRNVPFLGALPLDPELGRAAERGVPIVISDETSALAQIYYKIAADIMQKLHFAPAAQDRL